MQRGGGGPPGRRRRCFEHSIAHNPLKEVAMATRTISTVRGGFDWRGIFGSRRGKLRGAARESRRAHFEPLEGRQLLSVTLVSANSAGQAAGAVEDNQEFAI